ncbi:hypothetical protein FDC45_13915 [Clostridium botulinum]|uniref:Uncharacterized protein n=1 Tax=Clostridium botulinum TaxID=1491 RepID=A0A846JHR4_CLOBO|nr:hypothetical protein [Clostridium botulinum]NFJ09754.1 hypothetical protein [Clostridium botulinum]NFK14734.1 hypothetical protein [Clostridium botulinum]NFM94282.1 hypothetical protein [Clostridium botulinum]NFO18428.1 hypothetical protein [Clostridium botulinum]
MMVNRSIIMKVSYKFVKKKYYAHKYWPCKINDFYNTLKLLANFLFPLLSISIYLITFCSLILIFHFIFYVKKGNLHLNLNKY